MNTAERSFRLDAHEGLGLRPRPELIGPVLTELRGTMLDSVRMGFLHSTRARGRGPAQLQTAADVHFTGHSADGENTTVLHYCTVLRDDGMSYGDYFEQLPYLLFLKMADERSRPSYNQASPIPAAYAWPALRALDGDALLDSYRHTLEELGKQPGTLALIFGKAQNKFDSHRLRAMLTLRAPCGRPISGGDRQDPAELRRVIVDLIDAENGSAMGADAKGDAYEGLRGRNA